MFTSDVISLHTLYTNRPEEFYTCDSPQLGDGSDDGQVGICPEVGYMNCFSIVDI